VALDVDFKAYRRANDMRAVRKNVTLPSWLNDRAEKEGINFSHVLQEASKERGVEPPFHCALKVQVHKIQQIDAPINLKQQHHANGKR